MKMTPLKKQSKNEQRKYYSSKRGSWNGVSPITRIVQSRRFMTETALNEKIDELQENDSRNAHQRQKARRRLRRGTSIRKADRLLRIINYGGYAPHRGYIDWGFSGRTLLHTGKYIKYPKNSNCQRWIKRETSLRIRRCRDVPAKGNYYRRLFDYWWTLY